MCARVSALSAASRPSRGLYEPVEKGLLQWDQVGDLSDLLTARIPGRNVVVRDASSVRRPISSPASRSEPALSFRPKRVDFTEGDREGAYALVRRTLVKLGYHRLGKPDKGLVKRYLGKVIGCSRAQLTRLTPSIERRDAWRIGAAGRRCGRLSAATRGWTFGCWRRWARNWIR